jgi:hypothetical protein
MANNDVRVSNLPSDKPQYQVALDLMSKIAYSESKLNETNAREYYLTLYRQCYEVVYRGKTYEEAVSMKPKAENSSSLGFNF